MFAQDPVTGQLYDVPDYHPYGMGYAQAPLILYDGLGNPVGGIWDTITSAAKALVPAVASAIPGIGPAIAAAAPLVSSLLSPSAPRPPMPAAAPAPMPPAMPPVPAGAFQTAMPYPPPFPAPMPPGWMQPTLPYTGLQPRRFYMRCAAWPGPRGLVPSAAASMAPGIVPATVVPPVVVPPIRTYRPRHRRR
jgi:hypothetical protein